MKKCPKCSNSFFIVEEDRGIQYIVCTSCRSVVGTLNSYDIENGVNQITELLREHNNIMLQSVERMISNQATINNKIDEILDKNNDSK